MTDIVELATLAPDFTSNPNPHYAALHARGPVHRVRLSDGQEVWLIVGHDESRAALADPRFVALTNHLRNIFRTMPEATAP